MRDDHGYGGASALTQHDGDIRLPCLSPWQARHVQRRGDDSGVGGGGQHQLTRHHSIARRSTLTTHRRKQH
jgi:hypothetical protein